MAGKLGQREGEEAEAAMDKRTLEEQEADSVLRHNTGVSISENMLANICFGDTVLG